MNLRFPHCLTAAKLGLILLGTLLVVIPVDDVMGQSVRPDGAVEVSTAWSTESIRAGEPLVLAVVLDVAEGYHIGNSAERIRNDDQGKVMPTKVALSSEDSPTVQSRISAPDFPPSAASPTAENENHPDSSHLSGRTIVYLPVQVMKAPAGESLEFQLSVTSQACDDEVCFAPQTVTRTLTIPVAGVGALPQGCAQPELFQRWSDRRAQKVSDRSQGVDYKSKEPPIGPPWVRDLQTAQKLALQSGRPIFLYSTKTFCPHCVIVESEMLSAPELKPYYDRAIWLYVYRDFKGGAADRRAERTGIRYSLSSWPQLWLIDPSTLETIGEVGRSVDAFAEATAQLEFEPTHEMGATRALAESEARAVAFENDPTLESAVELLDSEDVVAQLLAARWLTAQEKPEELTSRARRLLTIPNDALRYEVLTAIGTTGDRSATDLVAGLAENPRPSRNFNVLRSHAIKALAVIGDADTVDVIAPHARGTARNGNTGISIKAMAAIAARHPAARENVLQHLVQSFPPIENSVARLVTAHAKQVHDQLQQISGREVEFPETYDEVSRQALIQEWSKSR